MSGLKAEAQLNRQYFYYVGQQCILESRYREAIDVLGVLLKVDTTAYDGFFLRGVAKFNLSDYAGAESDFSTAIKINSVFTRAYQYRAITRTNMGNYDDALSDFSMAIDIRPDNEGFYYSRSIALFLNQQFEAAIKDLDYFIRKRPYVVDAYINRGTCHLMLKDTVSAFKNYDKAIQVNRFDASGYLRRGGIYLMREMYDSAFVDLGKSIALDSMNIGAYFNRAIANANTNKPLQAIADLTNVIRLDSLNSLSYFNRAIIYSQIGDYQKALADYTKVTEYSPQNVLVFFNRGNLNYQLGRLKDAEKDFSHAIELYPDFANAYMGRSQVKYAMNDMVGSKNDKLTADKKIADYRSKMATDSNYANYADTSKMLNKLLSFDADFGNRDFDNVKRNDVDVKPLPMYRIALRKPGTVDIVRPSHRYENSNITAFLKSNGLENDYLTALPTNLEPNDLKAVEKGIVKRLSQQTSSRDYFAQAVVQHSLKQYNNAVKLYTQAINLEPNNPFYLINRGVAYAEMIEFISSLDSRQNIVIDADPVNRLKANERKYNYDEALRDVNLAISIAPQNAYLFYNRANIRCLSGDMTGAIEDYTTAITLHPYLAEAFYNRGMVQLSLKDTHKGYLDLSRAGELGIEGAYQLLSRVGR